MVVTCLVYNLECSSFEQYDTGVDCAYRLEGYVFSLSFLFSSAISI